VEEIEIIALDCSELTKDYYMECDENDLVWDESINMEGYTAD